MALASREFEIVSEFMAESLGVGGFNNRMRYVCGCRGPLGSRGFVSH